MRFLASLSAFSLYAGGALAFAPASERLETHHASISLLTEPSMRVPHSQRTSTSSELTTTLYAKKKKGGKKKGGGSKSKKSGFEWAASFSLKPFEAKATRELASTAAASFEGRTGKPLCDELRGAADVPKVLWNAPVACVVVGTSDAVEAAADTGEGDGNDATEKDIVTYANMAALETVGLKPDEYERFIAPSGPGVDRDANTENAITIDLPAVMKGEKRYEGGYKKMILRMDDENGNDASISIVDAHRWALEKSALIDGKFVTDTIGVAYAWEQWTVGGDTIRSPGGVSKPMLKLEELEEAVAKQAAVIRELKEEEGFGNKDPEVVEAVAELLRLKDQLATVA